MRFHIGLALECPLDAVTLAGHSFQKFSWAFNADGTYSKQLGLVVTIEPPEGVKEEAFDWKAQVLREATPFVIRCVRKDGKLLRADQHDTRVKGHKRDPKRDERLTDFVYAILVDETFRATPETLTRAEPKDPIVLERPLAAAAAAPASPPSPRGPIPAAEVMTPEDLEAD